MTVVAFSLFTKKNLLFYREKNWALYRGCTEGVLRTPWSPLSFTEVVWNPLCPRGCPLKKKEHAQYA